MSKTEESNKRPILTSNLLKRLKDIERTHELRLYNAQMRIKDEIEHLEKMKEKREWKEGLKVKYKCKKCEKSFVVLTDGLCGRCLDGR